jgi:pimeloyl-[acyl-carrier protein] methyl ester esterase
MQRILLFPGLDGTGALFEDFLRAAPAGVTCDVVALPQEPLGYAELVARLAPRLGPTKDTILIAESFSGPLAVLLAGRHRLAALVLCNSFVTAPWPRALAALPLAPFFHFPLPARLVRRFLVGTDARDDLVERVRSTVAGVPPAVLAARVAAVLSVDVRDALARCETRLLYLRGVSDRLVPEASVEAVVAAASAAVRVVTIRGPHLLLQAAPEEAWRAIQDGVLEPQAP